VLLHEGIPSVLNFYPTDTRRRGGRLNDDSTSHSTSAVLITPSSDQWVDKVYDCVSSSELRTEPEYKDS